MNSCLYECSVMHHRFAPKVHHFQHSLFMFYLDLDELDQVARQLWLFSHNRKNLYSFADRDHEPSGPGTLKECIVRFLAANKIEMTRPDHPANTLPAKHPGGKIMLLTLPRICGYIFNPISVYYCFDEAGQPVATVVEVGNTFREMKLYLLRAEDMTTAEQFEKIMPKHFTFHHSPIWN